MDPLWKVPSGEFAGWRSGNDLYDAGGNNVGYFRSDTAYSLNGDYIGEIYRDDWIGKRQRIMHGTAGPRASKVGIAMATFANRAGLAIAGWEDPDF